jgi:hypothetical protein
VREISIRLPRRKAATRNHVPVVVAAVQKIQGTNRLLTNAKTPRIAFATNAPSRSKTTTLTRKSPWNARTLRQKRRALVQGPDEGVGEAAVVDVRKRKKLPPRVKRIKIRCCKVLHLMMTTKMTWK